MAWAGQEAADMVLVRSQLSDVVVALHLSTAIFHRASALEKTLKEFKKIFKRYQKILKGLEKPRGIQLNFLFSLGYNSLGIPLAAGLFFLLTGQPLAPFVSGGAMAMSSVSVVLSSLLLRRYRPPSVVAAHHRSGFGREALSAQLTEERCTVENAKLFVQGKAISCGALWGGSCDCASRHSSCPCRQCKASEP